MLGVAWLLWRIVTAPRVAKDRTLEAYLKRHPDCLDHHGRVTCYRCGISGIWMKQYGTYPGGVLHSHICRQCGVELYQSVLR